MKKVLALLMTAAIAAASLVSCGGKTTDDLALIAEKGKMTIGYTIYEPMNYMLRAWVLNDFLNQQKAAKGLYGRVIDLELDHSERVGSLLGFARLFDGKTAQAVAWIDAILAEPDYDGKNHYYGACFYAWAGKPDKALDCMEASLKAGYANYHDWTANNDGRINVGPLRDTARFKTLMETYKSLF